MAGLAGDPRDGVDRVTEDVAVVDARALAESAHLLTELLVDERVEDHRRPALGPVDGEAQVVHRLDPRVDDVLELLVGELGLERLDEPFCGRTRRVRDHVELNRGHPQERSAGLKRTWPGAGHRAMSFGERA